MAEIVNFNAQLAPLEHVEKIVRQEQEHGQTARLASLMEAPSRLSKDNEQVRETTPQQRRKVDERHGEGGGAFYPGMQKKPGGKKREEPGDAEPSFEAESGSIVNLKV